MKHPSKCKHLFYRSVPQDLVLMLLTALIMLTLPPGTLADIPESGAGSGTNSMAGKNNLPTRDPIVTGSGSIDYALPLAIRYDGSLPSQDHRYQVHVGPMYSNAVGSVKVTSTAPRKHPALRFNYLSTDQDRKKWVSVRFSFPDFHFPCFLVVGSAGICSSRRTYRPVF